MFTVQAPALGHPCRSFPTPALGDLFPGQTCSELHQNLHYITATLSTTSACKQKKEGQLLQVVKKSPMHARNSNYSDYGPPVLMRSRPRGATP